MFIYLSTLVYLHRHPIPFGVVSKTKLSCGMTWLVVEMACLCKSQTLWCNLQLCDDMISNIHIDIYKIVCGRRLRIR